MRNWQRLSGSRLQCGRWPGLAPRTRSRSLFPATASYMVTCDRFTSPKQPLVRRSGTASQARARGAHPTSAEERVPDPHTRQPPAAPTITAQDDSAWRGDRADWIELADRLLGRGPAARLARPRAHHAARPRGRLRPGRRRPRGLRPHLPARRLPHRRRARRRACDDLADWYATGMAAGTDPASPERWVRLDEHPQAKVEAASIALILDLTRPVDLGPPRPAACRSGSSSTWRPRSATRPTRGSTGSGSGSSCRPSCARSAAPGRPPRSPRTSPPTTRSAAPTAGWPTARPRATTTTPAGRCTSTRSSGRGWRARPTSPPARRERDVAALDRFLQRRGRRWSAPTARR